LRHPGLGWLSFVFPDKEAAAIAEWLTRDLPTAPPSTISWLAMPIASPRQAASSFLYLATIA
jgi:hypothetical protein